MTQQIDQLAIDFGVLCVYRPLQKDGHSFIEIAEKFAQITTQDVPPKLLSIKDWNKKKEQDYCEKKITFPSFTDSSTKYTITRGNTTSITGHQYKYWCSCNSCKYSKNTDYNSYRCKHIKQAVEVLKFI